VVISEFNGDGKMGTKTELALGQEITLSEVLDGLHDELIKTQQQSNVKHIRF
jgi:hypothetical protein